MADKETDKWWNADWAHHIIKHSPKETKSYGQFRIDANRADDFLDTLFEAIDNNKLDLNDDDIRYDINIAEYTIFLEDGSCLTVSSNNDSKTINKSDDDLKVKEFIESFRSN